MPQTISFSQLVSNLSLAQFQYNMPYIMTSDRGFEPDFMDQTYQPGSTVNIRKVNRYIPQRGRILTPQDTLEETVPLTIGEEYGTAIAFNSKELTLEVTKAAPKYHERYISPVVQALAADLEKNISASAILDLNYVAGSPTAPFSDFGLVDLVNAQMTELAMPKEDDVSMVLSPRDSSALKASNQNAFNPTLNTDISFKSQLGRYSRFQMYESPATFVHQAGTGAGTPVTSAAVTSGSTIIALSGFTASQVGVLRAGDTISFGVAGTNSAIESVNPITRDSTGQLMTFTVQSDSLGNPVINSSAGGTATIIISPAVISDPANPRRNVSQPIPINSQVNLLGAGLRYRVSVAYTSRALSLVMPPLARVHAPECGVAVDKETGISLRVTIGFDMVNGMDMTRIEFLAGFKWHQEYAIKIISAA